jgi:hypothetical protein
MQQNNVEHHLATIVAQELAKKTSVMQPLKEDRFLCGFSHIFAGGYSAGDMSSCHVIVRQRSTGLSQLGAHIINPTLRHHGAPCMSGVHSLQRSHAPHTCHTGDDRFPMPV